MLAFLLMFIAVYGGMHAYVFWRFHAAFPGLGHWRWAIAFFFLLMVLGPVISRYLEHLDFPGAAKFTGVLVFTWCALAFWLFCYCALIDLWTLLFWGLGQAWPRIGTLVPTVRWRFLIPAIVAGVSLVWGLIEVQQMRVPKIVIEVPNLPDGRDEVRIMQISDVHLGIIIGPEKVKTIAAIFAREQPDILVSTGDLADGAAEHLEVNIDALAALKPPMGKYAVMGNHEFYVGEAVSVDFHERAGFQVLRGEAVSFGNALILAGVDDPAARRFGITFGLNEERALIQAGPEMAVVLLKHQPAIDPASAEIIDLQLSGHTHGGQIFPFGFFVAMAYRYHSGLYKVSERAKVYVNRGTGTWGPRLRVLAPPEVSIIILRRRPQS